MSYVPEVIDSSSMWNMYRPCNLTDDITDHFYKNEAKINIEKLSNVDFDVWRSQFKNYKQFDYHGISPYIEKYFSPSQEILNIETELISKYKIQTNNCCAVYYRSTDKCGETSIGSFQTFNDQLNETMLQNKDIQIIVQTDSSMFLEYMKIENPNIIVIYEKITSTTNCGIHNENSIDFNYHAIKYLLTTVLIISKCKFIICSSGNVSHWIMLYRQNGANVRQYLNNEWI